MFRRVLGGLTSTAVMAGLATAGVVATATPASAAVANPTLAGCGIPITLVMDASGSISGDEITAMRTASKAFLSGLEGTGSTARILQFATTSEQIATRTPIQNGSNLNSLNNAIDTIYKNGAVGNTTNWESALWRATVNDPTGLPPSGPTKGLVVFLTDGDPNTIGGVNGSPTSGTDATTATNAAAVYADALKTAGNRMLGVGIGMTNTGQQDRLKAVTGPNLVTSIPANTSINDFDVVVTNDFTELSSALKRVAVALCGGTVTVTKKTDAATPGTYVAQGDWPFTMRVTPGTAPTDYTWLQPVQASGDTVQGTTATATSNGPPPTTKGMVKFQYSPKDTTTRTVRISESLTGAQAGFAPRTPQGYSCTINGLNPPTQPVTGELTVSGTTAYFEIQLKSDESASCDVFNTRTRGTLKVTKIFDKPAGLTLPNDFFEIDYTCADGAAGTLKFNGAAGPNGQSKTVEVPTGDCTVTEKPITDPTGWTFGTPTYTPVDPNNSGRAKVTVTTGQTAEAKVTNTVSRNKGTLKVTKIFDKPAGLSLPNDFFEIDYTCADGAAGTLKFNGAAGPNGQSKTVEVPTGDCTVTEKPITDPAGWTFGAPTYTPVDPNNSGRAKVTVTTGQTAEAKVTNTVTRNTGRLLLVKEVPEPTGALTPDKWTLKAKNDASPQKNYSEPGNNTQPREVWAETPYTLSETPDAAQNNYTAGEWSCDIQQGDVAATAEVQQQLLDGNVVTVPTNTTVVCRIVNTRNLAKLKLVKQVEGKNNPNDWTLTAKAGEPEDGLNISTKGGSGQFEDVYAGTEYTLAETGPGGYSPSDWVCLPANQEPVPQAEGQLNKGDKITLERGQRVECTIVNTRDLGSLTITKEFNPQASGYTGTFDINYTCVDGADTVKQGTVSLAAGTSETISGLPTGTTCTVTEPKLPANPTGWTFNPPTFTPANGQATVTTKDQTASVTVVNSVAQVSPVVVKKICPIDVTLQKPQPKKVGNKILTKKIKTNKSACVLVKPVVLCRPLNATAAGETAFCDTKATKKGRITVKTKGYDAVKVTVIVRAKPKPGFEDRWKPNTWRKTWILR